MKLEIGHVVKVKIEEKEHLGTVEGYTVTTAGKMYLIAVEGLGVERFNEEDILEKYTKWEPRKKNGDSTPPLA